MSFRRIRTACKSSRPAWFAQLAAAALVLAGVFSLLRTEPTSLPLGAASRAVAAGILSLLFLLAAAAAPGCQVRLAGGVRAAWRSTLRRVPGVGLALSPLALLPLCRGHDTALAVVVGAALVAYATGPGRSTLRARRAGRGQLFGPWEVALLGFCAFVAIIYVQIGLRAKGNFQPDAAYYFGVAKHMALTRRFEEPIVWHFLRTPPHVPTAPFDYWGGLTSVLLVPFLWLFGPTHQVANTVMACISALSVLVFWYLVAVRRVVKSPPVGALLILAFALAPSLSNFRFDAESIALYHLLALLVLVFAWRGMWTASTIVGALAYCTRPTGALLALVVWMWALYESRAKGTLRRVAATQLGILALVVGYGLVMFHSALGVTRQAAQLQDQVALYLYGGPPRIDLLHARLGHFYLVTRTGVVAQTLLQIVPGASMLLAAIVVAGILPWLHSGRRASRQGLLLWTLGLPLAVAVGLASGGIYVPWRTLHPLIPLVMLAGGQSLDFWLDWIWHRDTRRPLRAAGSLLLIALTGTAALRSVKVYGDRDSAPFRSAEVALEKLDPIVRGETVASNIPWYVIANTKSPAVSIPRDGRAAIAAVIRRYDVRWVVLVGKSSLLAGSKAFLGELRKTGRGQLGPYRLARDSRVHGIFLFRVTDVRSPSAHTSP